MIKFILYMGMLIGASLTHAQESAQEASVEGAAEPSPSVEPLTDLSEADSSVVSPTDKSQEGAAVTWFRPEVIKFDQKPKLSQVLVSGLFKPGLRIKLQTASVYRFIKSESGMKPSYYKLTSKSMSGLPAKVDKEGQFSFSLRLPEGNYQIPLVFDNPANPSQTKRAMQIAFIVKGEEVKLTGNEDAKGLRYSSVLQKKNQISLGLGFNYLTYNKNQPDNSLDVSFRTLKGPAYFFEYWRKINNNWEFALNYKEAPGATSSSKDQGILVAEGLYSWRLITFDSIYFPNNWSIKKESEYFFRSGFRLGIQYHMLPFLRFTGNAANELEIVTNNALMGALGYQAEYEPSPDWRFEFFMRYQYPFSTGSKFKISPSLAFDGSVGGQYNFHKINTAVGIFWYGQYHKYRTNEIDALLMAPSQSQQTLLFSNVELRLIYKF